MARVRYGLVPAALMTVLVACGGGGGGSDSAQLSTQTPGGSSSGSGAGGASGSSSSGSSSSGGSSSGGSTSTSAPLSDSISSVPIVGQFLADCLDTGTAVIQSFVAETPLPVSGGLPTLDDTISSATAHLPIVGGLVPSVGDPSVLVSATLDQITAMLPVGSLPGTLPVIGSVPVVCSTVPLPSDGLPQATDALGLVPVFGSGGNVVGVVLTTVDNLQSGDVPELTGTELPSGSTSVLEPLGSVVEDVLTLLPLSIL